MYLNGTFLGISTFFQKPPLPTPTVYDKITFFGDIIVDNIWIRNKILSNTEIDAMDYKIEPTWTSDTIFLAMFNQTPTPTLDAGNILNLTSPITSWDIYRQDLLDNSLIKLANVPASVKTYVDYTTQAYHTYIYEIFPITATQIGSQLQTNNLYTDYFGYYLIDPDTGISYKFDLNISSGNFQYEEDVTEYKTYTKYPAVTRGKQNYLKNSITALAGTISCTDGFLQPIEYINTLEAFITDGKVKLYKTRKGGIYKVYTRNFSYKILDNDGIVEQPMLVSFDVFEVEAV